MTDLGGFDRCVRVTSEHLESDGTATHVNALESPRDLLCHLVDERLRLLIVFESNAVLQTNMISRDTANADRKDAR